jgi:hypothetical protein
MVAYQAAGATDYDRPYDSQRSDAAHAQNGNAAEVAYQKNAQRH